MGFINDEEAGRNAANSFWWFEGRLSKNNVLSHVKTENKHITGKDMVETIVAEHGLIGSHTEIKAVRNNNFVKRNNNPRSAPDPGGTLEFELWSNAWDENNHIKPRKLWTVGWFPKMLHPERYNTNEIKVEKPTRLVFMLCLDDEGYYPYACINFENFSALEERLREIAPFNLEDIPSPLCMDYWRNENLNTEYNCWYVSFDKVKDLATITRMTDVQVQPEEEWRCPIHIQTARCMNLLNSCNNPSFDRRVEAQKARAAARAYNREHGLPEDAPLRNFAFFDSEKMPSWVKCGIDELPDWFQGIE